MAGVSASKKKRRHKRQRCSITVDFALYAPKKHKGSTSLKNVSKGGLSLIMKKAPEVEAVIVITSNHKKLAKYVDFDSLILDPKGNPIARVVHVKKEKNKRTYTVGVRFLEKPIVGRNVKKLALEPGEY